jgi:hypothetical protein
MGTIVVLHNWQGNKDTCVRVHDTYRDWGAGIFSRVSREKCECSPDDNKHKNQNQNQN